MVSLASGVRIFSKTDILLGQRCYEWEDGQVTYSSDLRTGFE